MHALTAHRGASSRAARPATSSPLPATSVLLIDPRYQGQGRVGGNLNLSGPVLNNRFRTMWGFTYFRHSHIPGTIDLNFNPVTRFTLADEANRPVYVQP